jgi:hypothetical protein
MFKPDGSQRRQIGAGGTQPASPEVAQLDRFEVVSDNDGQVNRLLLYDDEEDPGAYLDRADPSLPTRWRGRGCGGLLVGQRHRLRSPSSGRPRADRMSMGQCATPPPAPVIVR